MKNVEKIWMYLNQKNCVGWRRHFLLSSCATEKNFQGQTFLSGSAVNRKMVAKFDTVSDEEYF